MTPYRKFMVLSSPRSGTHMLRASLDGHPRAVCLDEMFNPDYTRDLPFTADTPEEEILDQFVFGEYGSEIQAVGFCIHRLGARFGNWPRLWEILEGQSDLPVISLSRENLLRRYLSFQLRNHRNLVTRPPSPMEFDPEKLVIDFQRQRAKVEEFDRRFASHPVIHVAYERLCADHQGSMQSIQQFLGLPYVPLKIRTKRRMTPRLSSFVTNYRELKQHFSGSEWESFFDD